MKKISLALAALLAVSSLVFSGCSKSEAASSETDAQYQYYHDYDVLVKVKPMNDCTLTKSCNDSYFFSVTATKADVIYKETVEKYKSDSYFIERHYDADNTLIVTIINDGVNILGVIMSDEYEAYVETKSLREDGESYRNCVKRVYKEMIAEAEEETPMLCDLTPVCAVGASYIAIVGCVKDFME